MRKMWLTSVCSLVLVVSGVLAHERSALLTEGQWVVGIVPGGSDGFGTLTSPVYDASMTTVTAVNVTHLGGPGTNWGGDQLTVEYGLTPLLSVGVRSTLMMYWGVGFAHNVWDTNAIHGAAFANLDLTSLFGLNKDPRDLDVLWHEEVQVVPAVAWFFGGRPSTLNLHSGVNASWRVVDIVGLRLSPYLDSQVVFGFSEPWTDLGTLFVNNARENYRRNESVDPALTVQAFPGASWTASYGIEALLADHWLVSVGAGVRLADWSGATTGVVHGLLVQNLVTTFPGKLEIELKYLF